MRQSKTHSEQSWIRGSREWGGGVSTAIAVMLVISSAQIAWSQPKDESLRISVLLYQYTEISPAVLVRAEQEAGRILRQAGVRLNWTDCPIHPVQGTNSGCHLEPAPGEIRVRILARPLNNVFQDSIFGFAIAPVWASVYYESAVHFSRVNRESELDVSVTLGCLIAHEIGHLLLGQNAHTASGIMQPRWEANQLHLAMIGSLLFNPEQARLIQTNVRARTCHLRFSLSWCDKNVIVPRS